MSEQDFISQSRIAIVGLGLMGGSLALALHGRCQGLLGCDQDPSTLEYADQQKLFSQLTDKPGDILPTADVVVLATPLNSILHLIERLPNLHPGSPIVVDLGSTKTAVMSAYGSLPPRFDPLGGHPMCGKEKTGIENAEKSLFKGAAFAFTPLARTSNKARAFAEDLAVILGARALWLDAEIHDRWCAATSHLPYLVASAIAGSTPTEAKPLVGPGIRSTTRIAATPASIMLDVLQTNRENILEQMESFQKMLDHYRTLLLSGEYETVKSILDENANRQRELSGGEENA